MKINLDKGLSESQLKKTVSTYMEKVDTAFSSKATVDDVLKYLRSHKLETKTSYFYAVDENYKLFGYFSARDLVFNDEHKQIGDIAVDDIIKVSETDLMDKALMLIVENQLMALPVVNEEGHLSGLLEVIPPQLNQTTEKKSVRSSSTRDFFQLVGISVVLGRAAAGSEEFRSRMPWLLCNIFSGLICAAIAHFYQLTLAKVVILAMFIPLVLTLSESISMQSMALSLQFLHQKNVPWGLVMKRLLIELRASFLLGLSSAILVGLAYLIFSRDIQPMIAITVSILLSMVCASAAGVILPVALHAASMDPKVAAGPIVLMLTDMVATAIYLGGSTWWLNSLIR